MLCFASVSQKNSDPDRLDLVGANASGFPHLGIVEVCERVRSVCLKWNWIGTTSTKKTATTRKKMKMNWEWEDYKLGDSLVVHHCLGMRRCWRDVNLAPYTLSSLPSRFWGQKRGWGKTGGSLGRRGTMVTMAAPSPLFPVFIWHKVGESEMMRMPLILTDGAHDVRLGTWLVQNWNVGDQMSPMFSLGTKMRRSQYFGDQKG